MKIDLKSHINLKEFFGELGNVKLCRFCCKELYPCHKCRMTFLGDAINQYIEEKKNAVK